MASFFHERILPIFLILLLLLVGLIVGWIGVQTFRWTVVIFSRVRQMGYGVLTAFLVSASGWLIGPIGAAIWEIYLSKNGLPPMIIGFIGTPAILLILLRILPHRRRRMFGPRQARYSRGRSVTLFLSWCWFIIPAGVVVLWAIGIVLSDVFFFVLVVSILFAWGAWFVTRFVALIFVDLNDAAAATTHSIQQYLTEDPRPAVLYLRPFQMDHFTFVERDERKWTFEHYFADAFREFGPFVALGNPQDYIPPMSPFMSAVVGAVRLYATDSDWVQRLDELARRSSCIVVEMARSDNLRVEYEHLRREKLQDRLFVFTRHPHLSTSLRRWEGIRFGMVSVRWQEFSDGLVSLGYELGFGDPGPGSVITFDPAGRGILLTTEAKTAAEFFAPIRAWIEKGQKIGRCIPTSCVSCSREFHVFPADVLAVRDKWCRNCERRLAPKTN